MKKKYIIPLLVGLVLLAGCAPKELPTYQEGNPDALRFHVIANSDSAEDQRVKGLVRDRVLTLLPDLIAAENEAQAEEIIAQRIPEIEQAANEVLCQQHKNYGAKATLGVFSFPTKVYQQTVYPAGEYRALRLELGEAGGQNWWCVMFPPLCLIDAAEPQEGRDEVPDDQTEHGVEFRSIFAKWWEEIKTWF